MFSHAFIFYNVFDTVLPFGAVCDGLNCFKAQTLKLHYPVNWILCMSLKQTPIVQELSLNGPIHCFGYKWTSHGNMLIKYHNQKNFSHEEYRLDSSKSRTRIVQVQHRHNAYYTRDKTYSMSF